MGRPWIFLGDPERSWEGLGAQLGRSWAILGLKIVQKYSKTDKQIGYDVENRSGEPTNSSILRLLGEGAAWAGGGSQKQFLFD